MLFNRKEYNKRYRQSEKGKVAHKKYRQSEKGEAEHKKYRQSEKGRAVHKKSDKKYFQSEKGHSMRSKNHAKERGLGFVPLYQNPFSKNEKYTWHHINDEYVVAMPKDIHELYIGNENHRELCMNAISQLYEVMP